MQPALLDVPLFTSLTAPGPVERTQTPWAVCCKVGQLLTSPWVWCRFYWGFPLGWTSGTRTTECSQALTWTLSVQTDAFLANREDDSVESSFAHGITCFNNVKPLISWLLALSPIPFWDPTASHVYRTFRLYRLFRKEPVGPHNLSACCSSPEQSESVIHRVVLGFPVESLASFPPGWRNIRL